MDADHLIVFTALRLRMPAVTIPIVRKEPKGRADRINQKIVSVRPAFKLKPCESVENGAVILCKLRGYCEWPAFVTKIDGNMIAVEFFGDHTTHKTTSKNIFNFGDGHDLMVSQLRARKSPLYKRVVEEAEGVLGVPQEFSILNRI